MSADSSETENGPSQADNVHNREALSITSRLLGRNVVISLVGRVLPLPVGLVTIGILTRELGPELFAVFSLAWIVLGYFTILDFGLSRAVVYFVGKELGESNSRGAASAFTTTVLIQTSLGIAGGVGLAVASGFIVNRIFHISDANVEEAQLTIIVVAVALPVALMEVVLRGGLQAAQRFGPVAAIQSPLRILGYIAPVVGVIAGMSVPGIVMLVVVARVLEVVGYATLAIRTFPIFEGKIFDRSFIRPLFVFGGWTTIGSLIGGGLTKYAGQLLLVSIVSATALGYYAGPYEFAQRILIIPVTVGTVLFPAISVMNHYSEKEVNELVGFAIKVLLLVMTPFTFVLFLFAEPILELWLGAEFATEGLVAFKVLVVSTLIGAVVATMPLTVLNGLGRPDIAAKLGVMGAPVYILITWLFITWWGIDGAAFALLAQVTLTSLLVLTAVLRIRSGLFPELRQQRLIAVIITVGVLLIGGALVAFLLPDIIVLRVPVVAVLLLIFAAMSWFIALSERDRNRIQGIVRKTARTSTDVESSEE